MKALILSDIHIDFQYEYAIFPVKDDYTDEECLQSFNRWWDMMQFPEADVLLSAGDFSNDYRTFQQFMKFISGKYKDVYIVLGNHDLVVKGATPSKSNQEFKTSEDKIAAMRAFLEKKCPNVHLLEGDSLNGIAGCMGMCKLAPTDHLRWSRHWFDGAHWKYMDMQPETIWNHYRETMNNLIATRPKVMMTHYAPYEMGVAFEYRLDRNTPFFYFDGKEFLEQMPDDSYWICGHVHNVFSTDYTKENGGIVHIRANPHGYPGERSYGRMKEFVIDL